MARHKNADWSVSGIGKDGGSTSTWDEVQVSLLMDIRDELQHLNATFDCTNAQQIPSILRGIRRKLPTPKRRKGKAKK